MTPYYVLLWELIFCLILYVQPTENTQDNTEGTCEDDTVDDDIKEPVDGDSEGTTDDVKGTTGNIECTSTADDDTVV